MKKFNYKTINADREDVAWGRWIDMMTRCYNKKKLEKFTTYKDCVVCEEWHTFNNFREWYHDNYYEIDGEEMQLDKDILIKNNKVYSPNTCIFVPKRINILFTKNNKRRGKYPIGVDWHNGNCKYRARCSILDDNGNKKSKNLGYFNDIDSAFNAYKNFKEKYIASVAEEYYDKIPKKLYKSMCSYTVDRE